MSDLRSRLPAEMKAAMKSKDRLRLSTVRLMLAAIKDKDLAAELAGKGEVTDAEILDVLQKMVKTRSEAAETYKQAGREDLHGQEMGEVAIIREFLPKAMDASEARAAIETVIAEIGAKGVKDMGRTMAELKTRFPGRMDFGKASGVVKELLK